MKKSIIRAITTTLILACIIGFIGYQKALELQTEPTNTTAVHIENTAIPETETQSEVYQFLSDKYNLTFQLWGPVEHDLYVYHIYADHAEWECHILMPENTDDIEQYQKDLSWKIADDELIINETTGELKDSLKIDISAETATSAKTGIVYNIYKMESPLA